MKSRSDVVTAWLRSWTVSGDAELLNRLVRYSAENGWRCVLALHRMCEATGSDVDLASWFGPIERLLHYHGEAVKDRFVDLARRESIFRARLAPLARSRSVAPEVIDALAAISGWQRRSIARRPNRVIDRAVDAAELDIRPPVSVDDWRDIDKQRGDAEFAQLASAWLEHRALQWSFDEVHEVVTGADAGRAWDLILHLVRDAGTDHALGVIGAGPIEDFLGLNGEAWIAEIEQKAAEDPKFCHALSGAWQGRTPDAIWTRVQRVTADCRRERYFEPPSAG